MEGRNACGRAVCDWRNQKRWSVSGGRRRDWHWQNWQQGSAPTRCPDRRWTRPEGARRVFPVAQAPGPRLIWQTGTMLHPAIQTCSVGPVRPLLPGVAVQFSLLTTQFRPSVCSLFVSRASCLLLHSCHTHSHANAVMSHSAHWLLEEGLGRQAVTVAGPHGRVMADEIGDDESGNALAKQRTAGGSMFMRGSIPPQVVTRPRAQRPTPAAHRQPGTAMTVMRRGRRPDEHGHQPAGAAAHSG